MGAATVDVHALVRAAQRMVNAARSVPRDTVHKLHRQEFADARKSLSRVAKRVESQLNNTQPEPATGAGAKEE